MTASIRQRLLRHLSLGLFAFAAICATVALVNDREISFVLHTLFLVYWWWQINDEWAATPPAPLAPRFASKLDAVLSHMKGIADADESVTSVHVVIADGRATIRLDRDA